MVIQPKDSVQLVKCCAVLVKSLRNKRHRIFLSTWLLLESWDQDVAILPAGSYAKKHSHTYLSGKQKDKRKTLEIK